MKREERKAISQRLLHNRQAQERWGKRDEDFAAAQGEIFLGNFKQEEFDILGLKTKRRGDPARTRSGKLYKDLHENDGSFAVYIHSIELEMLKIRRRF
ncbi:hypothetical protein A2943_00500 [Candidatus Adlerbacteria bacterium RIFCSPLOWO2_01_FULL_51_16]|uniref:Uncharacterized protein n=1 Tax=Candidatus Adlerbacteria bacterium RIFCSPLOWO2_01_FULL_51_16 TaxID=1797243 RepID=A0A1F4XHY4_9BACT|nr:MAG: hypothetical protein A2943_00500 [Candidatus Adlerbacteria bacterium RIFCSPLOWO2_01_FULL_51_16]